MSRPVIVNILQENTVYSGVDCDVAVGDVSCFVTDACRAGKVLKSSQMLLKLIAVD